MGDQKRHGFKWTTFYGFLKAAARLAGQLVENEKLAGIRYLQGTIKILDELPVIEHVRIWAKITRKLKALGMVAFWVREVSAKNLLDYHLAIRECPEHLMANDGEKLKEIIRSICPYRLNMQFGEIKKTTRNWCNYICKSKVGGTLRRRKHLQSDDVDDVMEHSKAKYIEDVYKSRRLLFTVNCGLSKHGEINRKKFWAASRTKLTAQYKAEKQHQKKLNDLLDTAAKRLADVTDLNEEFVLKKLREEYEAYPGDKELRKQNQQLADDYYKSTPEYEEEIRNLREWEAKNCEVFDHLLRA